MENLRQFKSLIDLTNRFPDEQSCRNYIAELRWNGNPVCPHCNNHKVYTFKNGKIYKCAECRKQFTVKVGTIFEDSALPLQKWFMAIYLLTAHKKGISSLQLSRDINITQKSAWFMLHRIREIFKPATKKLKGIVEMDETYIGGKVKNMHENKKPLKVVGQPTPNEKTPVFGMVERKGNVVSIPVNDTTKETLQRIIKNTVRKGSKVMTDDYNSYKGLNNEYEHRIIFHTLGEHSKGIVYTNTIEGFWSLLKRGIIGIYHQVSPKHLHRYCNEFGYRYNTKGALDVNRFAMTFTKINGRLMYKDLIAK